MSLSLVKINDSWLQYELIEYLKTLHEDGYNLYAVPGLKVVGLDLDDLCLPPQGAFIMRGKTIAIGRAPSTVPVEIRMDYLRCMAALSVVLMDRLIHQLIM